MASGFGKALSTSTGRGCTLIGGGGGGAETGLLASEFIDSCSSNGGAGTELLHCASGS